MLLGYFDDHISLEGIASQPLLTSLTTLNASAFIPHMSNIDDNFSTSTSKLTSRSPQQQSSINPTNHFKSTTTSSVSPFGSDSSKKRRNMTLASFGQKISRILSQQWSGRMDFLYAQMQVIVVLIIAYIGNNWKNTYPRNDNQNYFLFWAMNGFILVVGLFTMQHTPSPNRIQILSRSQTEEWKGWMQWAFIMYHYYRATNVYNVIRVFVSSYVWMTGFGNFLYFDKKQDFSFERGISMWLRINYFPLLLSIFVGVPFDLLYIVPLHTTAFFITMVTCYVAKLCATHLQMNHWQKNCTALTLCFVIHVLFYETPCAQLLEYFFGHEIFFRFTSDKYSAVLGIISGYFWHHAQSFVTWANTPISVSPPTDNISITSTLPTSEATSESTRSSNATGAIDTGNKNAASAPQFTAEQWIAKCGQVAIGITMILFWWLMFGHINDKYVYNPLHPLVFWLPVFGWLMIRNSSRYLTEVHSTALEFFGKITLETYVLQFHVFMCRNVQHIPIVLPNSGPHGNPIMKFLNMLLTGVGFIALAYWARKITVTTQTTVTDLVVLLLDRGGGGAGHNNNSSNIEVSSTTEKVPLATAAVGGDVESNGNEANDDHQK